MPNLFAYTALIIWPVVAWVLSMRYKQDDAAILLLLVPFLFLPERVSLDFAGTPPLTKDSIPPLVAFFLFYFRFHDRSILSWPKERLLRLLLISLFLFPLLTFVNNREVLTFGPVRLPGLSFKDFIAIEFESLCYFYIPFMLGWKLLGSEEGHRKLLLWFLGFGLFYSLLALWEVRMSPQLHTQLYGFFPHSFAQQIRNGGFRAVVFQLHGLEVAILVGMWLTTAAGLYKAKEPKLRGMGIIVLLYLSVVLVLCKSMGSLMICIFFVPLILFTSIKTHTKVCSMLALIVVLYPLARSADLIPVNWVITQASNIDSERANSLAFRIENEDQLLERAERKRLFGWGTWGRNRVYSPITGADETVTDGGWVIKLGQYGLFGYLAIFGLMAFSVLNIRSIQKKRKAGISIYTSALMAVLLVNMIDMIPNATLTNLSFLIAGALFGLNRKVETTNVTKAQARIIS